MRKTHYSWLWVWIIATITLNILRKWKPIRKLDHMNSVAHNTESVNGRINRANWKFKQNLKRREREKKGGREREREESVSILHCTKLWKWLFRYTNLVTALILFTDAMAESVARKLDRNRFCCFRRQFMCVVYKCERKSNFTTVFSTIFAMILSFALSHSLSLSLIFSFHLPHFILCDFRCVYLSHRRRLFTPYDHHTTCSNMVRIDIYIKTTEIAIQRTKPMNAKQLSLFLSLCCYGWW